MFKIDIDKIDELQSISSELNTIIYLQDFVNMDFDENYEEGHLFHKIKGSATHYLYNCSAECVLKLKNLLNSDDFVKKIEI